MFRNSSRAAGFLMPLAVAMVCLSPTLTSAQKAKETVAYTPPTLSLTADSTTVSACVNGNVPQVHLNASASSPGNDPIRYRWSTNAGRINGDGPTVIWDLRGLAPGSYKASLEIETGASNGECQAFASTNVIVTPCPPAPFCPKVSVSCPANVALDQPLTFNSTVSGGTPSVSPIFNWTISAGKIVEGQGTPTIKVDTTGLAGQTIRATLSIDGYTLDCSASCAVQIPVPQPVLRKFDEFPDISRNDEKARLDNFAVELQNDPTSTAYVIVYPGHGERPGDAQRHSKRVVDYLVNTRAIDARRVITLTGSERNELTVELWIAPRGAVPPKP